MFTQPVSPPIPGPPAASAVSPSSSRPSRLRGLSYLRNYTHNHLLSRDTHHSNSTTGTSSASLATNLTRSVSYSPSSTATATATTTTAASGNNRSNRLTLVSSTPDAAIQPSRNASPPASGSPPPPIAEASEQLEQPSSTSDQAANSAGPAAAAAAAASAANRETGTVTAEESSTMTRERSSELPNGSPDAATPSIRFSSYYDPRATRPSLAFPPISRTLPTGSEVIRVGRYSERDSQAMANLPGNQPSSAPVGFKSKVVSRRHCEFWCEDGKWYIKDVKSSSGTFLNHIRLSPPSQESKAFPINDGDIVQLGIDFKGGEEMIFRCVKMRLELNRGWQNKLNTFNMAAHKRLRTMTSSGGSVTSTNSQDCAICLNSIAPCQSLFVAPCSHTWHFKCIKSLLMSPQYPIFVCPNCRAGADLEADVDEPNEEWQQLEGLNESHEAETSNKVQPAPVQPTAPIQPPESPVQDIDVMDVTVNVIPSPEIPTARSSQPHTTSEPLPIRNPISGSGRASHLRDGRTPSPPGGGAEGPITPRNNVGPWVFDGRAGQDSGDPASEMTSLNAAADMDSTTSAQSDASSRL